MNNQETQDREPPMAHTRHEDPPGLRVSRDIPLPWLIGIVSLILGAVIIVGAIVPTHAASMVSDEFVEPPPHPALVAARFALGILAVYYFALGVGLFIGWDPDGVIGPGAFKPNVVTSSLDRVLLYVLAGGVALDLLREPSANPVSAKTTSRRGRWRPWSR